MNFDDLDSKMRGFETAHDHCVLPGINIVVRLDGRSFTRLTKETMLPGIGQLHVPFDVALHKLMVDTIDHLMCDSGIRVVYGFTESDEISLLLHPEDNSFGRKERKLNSVLAGEASAFFSRKLNYHAVFDARVCQLPTEQLIVDYFRWRQEDAARNALSSHCFYLLLSIGSTPEQAHRILQGASTSAKNELLFEHGINFNELPLWQKHGSGLYWAAEPKVGFNPKTETETVTMRRRLFQDLNLPRGDEYGEFVRALYRKSLEPKETS